MMTERLQSPLQTVSSRRSRVAVIGVGAMGWHHVHNYHALTDSQLVAVVDPDPERLTVVRDTFECATYRTVDELLASQTIDAASVVAPATQHYALVCKLLSAGVHTLVEKPIATEMDDARRMMAVSREHQLILQVGHITRFFSSLQYLHDQSLTPRLIEARRMTAAARISDVGVILDLMIHDIDIVLGLVPSAIHQVSARSVRNAGSVHEDAVAAELVFKNGCVARLCASRIAGDTERVLSIVEPMRTLHLDFAGTPSSAVMTTFPVIDGEERAPGITRVFNEDNPLRAQLAHFLARIREGATPLRTLTDDIRSLQIAAMIRDRCRGRELDAITC